MEDCSANEKNNIIRFTSKAPAKIIISGEHSVVYNSKAISCAVNLYSNCEFILEKNINGEKSNLIELNLVNLNEVHTLRYDQINKIKDYISLYSNKQIHEVKEFLQNEGVDTFSAILQSLNIEKHALYFALMLNVIFSYYLNEKLLADSHFESQFEGFFSKNNLKVSIILDFSHGSGLGSSAAVNVSLASCLIKLANYILKNKEKNQYRNYDAIPIDKNLLFIFSYLGEKFFHLRPSGIDNITSIHKGMILFRSIKDFTPIQPSKIYMENFTLFIIDTKIKRDTKKFIQKVKDFKAKHEKVFMNSIDSIDYIAQEIYKYIIEENSSPEEIYSNLSQLFALNQNLLSVIQVSHQEINHIVNILSSIEVPSKLTGGGGGGYVLALVDREKHDLFIETTRKNGIEPIECQIVYD